MKKDKEVKTILNGGKQESRSCTGRGISQVASEGFREAVLCDLIFFFSSSAVLHYPAPAVTVIWSAGKPVKTELQ